MLDRFSEPLAVGVMAASLAGCGQADVYDSNGTLSPQACMQEWKDGGLQRSEDGFHISPAPAAELPPELAAAQVDSKRLVGFLSAYQVTQGGNAEAAEDIQHKIDYGELAGLVFEGNAAVPANYNDVWAGALVAPNTGAYLLPGEMDASYDLSGGVAENPQSSWNWVDTFGSEPVLFSTVFLDRNCVSAFTALDGALATTYEVSPQGVTQDK